MKLKYITSCLLALGFAGFQPVKAATLVELTFDDAAATSAANLGSLGGTQYMPTSGGGKQVNYGIPPSTANAAFGFDGGNQWSQGSIATTQYSTFALPELSSITVAYWVFPQQFDGYRTVFASVDGASNRLRAAWDSSGNVSIVGGAGEATTSTTAMTLNTWNHVALTYTNTGVSSTPLMYLNGTLIGNTGDWTGNILAGPTGFSVGSVAGENSMYGGIDNIFIIDSVLSQSQIQTLMTTNVVAVPEPAVGAFLLLGGALFLLKRTVGKRRGLTC